MTGRLRHRKRHLPGSPSGPSEDFGGARAARRRGIYLLPNLFTTAALFAGFFAIVQAMDQNFERAAIAIFFAMVLDGMDGRVARLTNTQSAFGEQYDSLSDMTSFGVAPAPRCGSRGSTPTSASSTSASSRGCRARRRRRWLPASSGSPSMTGSPSGRHGFPGPFSWLRAMPG